MNKQNKYMMCNRINMNHAMVSSLGKDFVMNKIKTQHCNVCCKYFLFASKMNSVKSENKL